MVVLYLETERTVSATASPAAPARDSGFRISRTRSPAPTVSGGGRREGRGRRPRVARLAAPQNLRNWNPAGATVSGRLFPYLEPRPTTMEGDEGVRTGKQVLCRSPGVAEVGPDEEAGTMMPGQHWGKGTDCLGGGAVRPTHVTSRHVTSSAARPGRAVEAIGQRGAEEPAMRGSGRGCQPAATG